jgi:hypothetical protein
MVVVEVGETNTKYQLHRALLTKHSDYFEKVLNGPWLESQENTVRLPDVRCQICKSYMPMRLAMLNRPVEIFVHWLYTSKLPDADSAWINLTGNDNSNEEIDNPMIESCAFASRILAPGFCKEIEHGIVSCLIMGSSTLHYSTIILAFEKLPPGSPILRLIVDAHCAKFNEEQDTPTELQQRDRLPHKLLVNVMLRYSKIIKDRSRYKLIACDYHDHGSDAERKACIA